MNQIQAQNAVLTELFKGYLENPGAIFDITDTIKKYGLNPAEFGDYLKDRGFIKNQRYYPTGEFETQISNAGILKIQPNYFNDLIDRVIAVLAVTGANGVMEILEWEPNQFQRAFDLAKHMESAMLVKALYLANEVSLELTAHGQDYYNRNQPDWM